MNVQASAAGLSGVSETLLITLAARAIGTARRAGDERHDTTAERICRELEVEPTRYGASSSTVKGVNARGAWFEARCLWALEHLDNPLFVNLGSGLDTLYERVGERAHRRRFEWIDSDLPDVVALRRQLLPDDARRRTVTLDITRDTWLAAISWSSSRDVVFVAEGLLMYLEDAQLATLFRKIAACRGVRVATHFIFDWASPAMKRFSRQHPAVGRTMDQSIVFHSSLARAHDIARFDSRWKIVAQFDVIRRSGFGPMLLSLAHLASTTRRFMGCAHAILA